MKFGFGISRGDREHALRVLSTIKSKLSICVDDPVYTAAAALRDRLIEAKLIYAFLMDIVLTQLSVLEGFISDCSWRISIVVDGVQHLDRFRLSRGCVAVIPLAADVPTGRVADE